MLVKFEERDKEKLKVSEENIDEVSLKAGKIEADNVQKEQEVKYNPTQEEINRLQEIINRMEQQKTEPNQSSNDPQINRLSYTGRNG